MIEFCNVSFCYENKLEESLRNVSFSVKRGEVVLLTGLSGCGKSTVLKCLNGLIPNLYEGSLSGRILLDGKELSAMSMSEISRQVGSVFQNPRSQFFTVNAGAELAFSMENYGFAPEQIRQRIDELSRQFYLQELLERSIFEISSGERQRLSLACALSLSPKILLFDEPSSNLDYSMTLQIGKYIKELKSQGYTILVADHRYFYLEAIPDKIITLENGEISGIYTEAEFRQSSYPFRRFSLFDEEYPVICSDGFEDCLQLTEVSFGSILKGITLQLKKGEVLALIGSNGAGKTTLAKILARMEKADSGQCRLPSAMFVMQDSDYQLFGASVENEIKIAPIAVSDEQAEEALTAVNLTALRHQHPFALSGGEKQRLQIATAYVSQAELIIFDEPTSGLDFISMERVAALIRKLAKRQAILVISHDYEFIRKTACRVAYLADGRIEQDFVLNEENVSKLNHIFQKMKGELL